MFFQYGTDTNEKQTAEEESQFWVEQLEMYLTPYSQRLDAYLDRRVVGNLTATVAGIVQTRSELTTSELGSAICGPEHAEAGTQRLQRALHRSVVGVGGDRRGALGTSGEESKGDGTARRNAAVHLGQQRLGEARKRQAGRIGLGTFQSGAPDGPQPTRGVQSARHSGECARV